MPFGAKHRRKSIKSSESTFLVASLLAVGLSVEFFVSPLRSSTRVNYASLFLFWLLWMLLPILMFIISALLKKQGR